MPHALTTTTLVLCLLWCSPAAFPQMQPTAPQTEEPQADQQIDEDIASKVVDPTSLLSTLTFQNSFTPSHWGIDDKANEMTSKLSSPSRSGTCRTSAASEFLTLRAAPSGQEVCLTWRCSTSSSSGKNGGICLWEAWLT